VTSIFSKFALFAVALMLATISLGLWSGRSLNEAAQLTLERARLRDAKASPELDAQDRQQRLAQLDRQLEVVSLDEAKRTSGLHILFGVATALVVMLVNGISVTYFIGTSRWCREVVETYGLDGELAARSARLKRKSFPLALLGMLTIVGVVALGAASDPGSAISHPRWLDWHLLAGLTGTGIVAASFYVQWTRMAANHVVIDQIMAEVRRIRAERGLDAVGSGT